MDILKETPEKMTFNSTGSPVEPELRPIWRISLLAIILKKLCRGSSASLKKMQVLYSLISSADKRRRYFTEGGEADISIRFDPLLDRAISLGLAEGIFTLDAAKSVALTNKGTLLTNKIYKDSTLFVFEKEFIENYSKSEFSDKKIDQILYRGVI
ncbi:MULTISPECIES: hypothetical protein [Enterobacteriaceae]|uniref:Uncharacterized protein n=1 Tax=Salmonella enterica TaxID=28901 RepID=A0A5U0R7J0_SALER|nr:MULTISPECIES: hypothetical protein [Enterobacteriaceae]EBQ6228333.1 hypothetical protein [Salmonella enterica subsp. enterica serovar Newport]EBO5051104.1 hypothetical protein [Salmonella enterica]ECK4066879.1 hypothetical protein [Salmonella enterica]ECN1058389.1 hypothetical protein [Salmonella enterica subsp. enterica serovar Newport]EJE0919861.1 hypothetical protein [Salmonella enterica]